MWILLSITTFGIVGSLMVYHLVRRRNAHFERQTALQKLVLGQPKGSLIAGKRGLNNLSIHTRNQNEMRNRNAHIWAFSCFLFFPAFYVLYFLTKDLQVHEEKQGTFFKEVACLMPNFSIDFTPNKLGTRKMPVKKYLAFTILTFGFASVYWLYKITNEYNNHFKMQWKIEDALVRYLEAMSTRD